MEKVRIGIIGGSGIYGIEGVKEIERVELKTPFGTPSDSYLIGSLDGIKFAFLPRHGRGHKISPSELNFRANIHGFKQLGVEKLISVSAVGSLKEELKPRDFVIPDQLYDRTKSRVSTFFENGIVAHVGMADPFCRELSELAFQAGTQAGITIHRGGTYVCIEGPQFSTRAESNVYRGQGFSIIGMTNLPEAKLAREAEMCYATVALVTDYDVWKDEDVTVEQVMANLSANSMNAKSLIKILLPMLKETKSCVCQQALATAIVTRPEFIPSETREKLDLIIAKYIK